MSSATASKVVHAATRVVHTAYWQANTVKRRLPYPVFRHWALGYSRLVTPAKIRRYGKPEPGDIVLDVGAMIGEFALPASLTADHVYALEPDYRSYRRLCTHGRPNLDAYHIAAGEATGRGRFNIASHPSSSSLDIVDVDAPSTVVGSTEVPVMRLDELPFIDEVTYLKIDAEGAEPEVLRGLGESRPARVSVDVSPERFGSSPAAVVRDILSDYGYEVTKRNETVVVGR